MAEYHTMMISDEDWDLKILNCTEESGGSKYRGCVVNRDNKIICPSLGYTPEYNIENDKNEILNYLNNLSDWSWFYSMEGTMVRLFYYNMQWILCTHKKLSAFRSKWSCKYTFGEMFKQNLKNIYNVNVEDTYEWFLSQLNVNKIYYFLIRCNSQNRIICHTSFIKPNETIIFLGQRDTATMEFSLYNTCPVLNEMQKPFTISLSLNTVDDILKYVEENIDPFQYQGIMGYNNKFKKLVKISNSKYKDLIKVRGNNHNIKFRYLEIRMDKVMVEKLYMLYPKMVSVFEDYEKTLLKIAKKIYQVYVERYIHSRYITLPRDEYIILQKCYNWYLENKHVRVSPKEIMDFINLENPLYLYKMIQRYKGNSSSENIRKEGSFPSMDTFIKNDENLQRSISQENIHHRSLLNSHSSHGSLTNNHSSRSSLLNSHSSRSSSIPSSIQCSFASQDIN